MDKDSTQSAVAVARLQALYDSAGGAAAGSSGSEPATADSAMDSPFMAYLLSELSAQDHLEPSLDALEALFNQMKLQAIGTWSETSTVTALAQPSQRDYSSMPLHQRLQGISFKLIKERIIQDHWYDNMTPTKAMDFERLSLWLMHFQPAENLSQLLELIRQHYLSTQSTLSGTQSRIYNTAMVPDQYTGLYSPTTFEFIWQQLSSKGFLDSKHFEEFINKIATWIGRDFSEHMALHRAAIGTKVKVKSEAEAKTQVDDSVLLPPSYRCSYLPSTAQWLNWASSNLTLFKSVLQKLLPLPKEPMALSHTSPVAVLLCVLFTLKNQLHTGLRSGMSLEVPFAAYGNKQLIEEFIKGFAQQSTVLLTHEAFYIESGFLFLCQQLKLKQIVFESSAMATDGLKEYPLNQVVTDFGTRAAIEAFKQRCDDFYSTVGTLTAVGLSAQNPILAPLPGESTAFIPAFDGAAAHMDGIASVPLSEAIKFKQKTGANPPSPR